VDALARFRRRIRRDDKMAAEGERAHIAGQLADLTRAVQQMADQLKTLGERADSQQERAETQQGRIDLAARELAEVSERLHAAANALRESI
jgi:peptidoglycan hydrolase CwlO-like protein